MSLYSLQHVNIRTDKLDDTVTFYRDVLGLLNGDRPAFKFPGAWMYAPDTGDAIMHLIGEDDPQPKGSGSVDHIAFGVKGWDKFLAKMKQLKIEHETREVPGGRLRQVFIYDPNGVLVELNFEANEKV